MPDETQVMPEEKQEVSPTAGATGTEAEKATAGTFTQEQVNTFTGKAREEGRKSAEGALLEKVKVKSFDELAQILEQYRKSEDEKLSEAERLKKELADAQAKREALESENKALKLRQDFDRTVKELNLKFISTTAAADAYSLLDPATLSDEAKGMKVAIKTILDERPYLFDKAEVPELDATKKSKTKSTELTDDKISEIRKRFRI